MHILYVAYCTTIHKYQGDEINTDYNIYDIERMSANELYTALGRTTKFNYIHLDQSKLKDKYEFHDYDKEKTPIYYPTKGGKYANSKIYEIVTTDQKYYIGSTTGSLKKRFHEHIQDKTSPIFGQTKSNIKLITNCICFNRHELEGIEGNYIEQYVKKYGRDRILNKYMVKEQIQIEPKLIIHKEIKNKYEIRNNENGYYIIQWRDENGKKKNIKRRYKLNNQSEIYEKIKEEQQKLIQNDNQVNLGSFTIDF